MAQAGKTVAEQVTDSVTQTSVGVIGVAPAHALAILYQTAGASAGIALQNAVHAQHNQNALARAVTSQAIALLLAEPAQAEASARTAEGLAALQQRVAALAEAIAQLGDDPAK